MIKNQHTLAHMISCSGIGLHTGCTVKMKIKPAEPNTGIVFVRKFVELAARSYNLVPAQLCTALRVGSVEICTVEHILAALSGLEIDNAVIELDADEIPAMDGSSSKFVDLIHRVGIKEQPVQRLYYKILRKIEVRDRSGGRLSICPSTKPTITYFVDYDHPMIQKQEYAHDCLAATFQQHIAPARTFAFLHEVAALWNRGLAKGGNLENTIVLSKTGIVNHGGLRFTNEFVRHKILDLIGDLSLLGSPIIGHVVAEKSGHKLHTKLVRKILKYARLNNNFVVKV